MISVDRTLALVLETFHKQLANHEELLKLVREMAEVIMDGRVITDEDRAATKDLIHQATEALASLPGMHAELDRAAAMIPGQ
jgi:DNA repair ATPase RecN